MTTVCHNCKLTVKEIEVAYFLNPMSPDRNDPEKFVLSRCPSCGKPILQEKMMIPHIDVDIE